MTVSAADHVAVRRRGHLVLALTALSGYVDALGVVALGGSFTSVMTGNLVLTGIGIAEGRGRLLLTSVLAILCYLAGCMSGGRIAARSGDTRPWPAVTSLVLTVELALLVVSALGWWAAEPEHRPGVALALLLLNAVALGLQSAAVARFGVSGLSTTYLTGTLTTLAIAVATGRPWAVFRAPLVQILLLVGGGALGAVLALHLPDFVPLLPPVLLAAVVVAAPVRPLASRRR